MGIIKFGDIVNDVKNNVDRSNNPYQYYVAGDHMDGEDLNIRRRGCFATDDVGPAFIRIFKPGQILYGSRRTYLKKVAVADFEGVCANTTFVFESKNQNAFCQKLLPFLIWSDGFTKWSISHSKGSTNPYVLFSDLANYTFNLPPLAEQKRLAEKLWTAYEVKQSYLNMIETTDEMVKSQFIEMFGDPVENLKGWNIITVKQAVEQGYIDRPLDGNHGEKHPKGDDYVTSGVPFLMAQDLKDKKVDFESCHFITEKQAATLTKGWAKPGDVLLTHKGTIGRIAIIQPSKYDNMLLTPQITYYRCLNGIYNEYLAAYFNTNYFVNQLNGMTTGSTRASVTITQQEKLKLLIPPIVLQKKYVSIVKQADKSKFELRESIKAIDKVIKSLINENL